MRSPFMMINLLTAVYWFDEALQTALREAGIRNVTRAQSLLIANISGGEQRAIRIARNLGVSRQAISQMLVELEARDIVVVEPDPDDRRARIVRLSEKSNKTRIAASRILRHLERELVERLGLETYNSLRDGLMRDWGDPPAIPSSVLEDLESDPVTPSD